ncbi:uncharacterized protein LOC124156536 [Ischnura elegans]|uniref:uncharacterized protein LOC124156536 n=1 Tax=Ischnura elegans TaxID=197161 RepID=UPI001ED871D0|nr:uncharacterized protein LOC124156536 [Ischnura elegans]
MQRATFSFETKAKHEANGRYGCLPEEFEMSSSDSENDSRLHSAIDHDFVQSLLTQASSAAVTNEKILPSLRTKEEQNDVNELKVTPGFQKHVAKHLDAIIHRSIKEVSNTRQTAGEDLKLAAGGIKLFSHSKFLITKGDLDDRVNQQMPSVKRNRQRKSKHLSGESSDDTSDTELHRLSSAAVSPEWVLQKKGAYGKCVKGKVVRLKDPGNGQLIEISPSN